MEMEEVVSVAHPHQIVSNVTKKMTNIAEFDVDFYSQRTRASYWRTRRLWIIRSFTATRPSAKPPATTGNYKLTNNKQQLTFTNNVHRIQR